MKFVILTIAIFMYMAIMIFGSWHSGFLSANRCKIMLFKTLTEIWGPVNQTRRPRNKKGDIVMLRPLGANVVVKADAVEEKTKSGIFIPDTASKEKPMQGTVLAVGNGAVVDGKRVPIDLKVGDSIVFAKYCGTTVKFEGEELLILAERDILAVVEPDTKKKK